MRIILLPVLVSLYTGFLCPFVIASATEKPEDPITPIGCFISVRGEGDYAYGYSVRLWLQGERIVGLIDCYFGSAADPPMGILTGVRYDTSTGRLSFQAKLTMGVTGPGNDIPSHDLLLFDGFLKPDELEGNVRLEDQLHSPPAVLDARDLRMRKMSDCLLQDYKSYDAWWRYWEPVYKARGARW